MKVSSQIRVSLAAVSIIMFCASSTYGQLDRLKELGGDKEARHAKKVEKSAASTEIKVVERNIKQLGKILEKDNEQVAEKKYDEFTARKDSISTYLAQIKSKDPKWDVSSYNESVEKFKTKDQELAPIHQKYVRLDEIEVVLAEVKKMEYRYKCGMFNKVIDYDLDVAACATEFKEMYLTIFQDKKVKELLIEYESLSPGTLANSSFREINRNYNLEFDKWVRKILDDGQKYLDELNSMDFNGESAYGKFFEYYGYLDYMRTRVEVVSLIDDGTSTESKSLYEKLEQKSKELSDIRLKKNLVSDEYSGKVIFTTNDAKRGEFESVEKTTKWDMSGPLYYRYFFDKTPMEFDAELGELNTSSYTKAEIHAVIYLKDKELMSFEIMDFYTAEELYTTALTLRDQMEIQKEVSSELSKGEYGNYPLRIELYLQRSGDKKRSSQMSSGEVTVVYNANTKSILRKNPEICLEPKKMSNSSLEQKFLSHINSKKAEGDSFFEKSDTFTGIRIIESEWRMKKTEYNKLIEGRYIDVIVTGKDKDGNCIKQLVGFYEDYKGSGTYGNLEVSGASKSEIVPCFCF